MQSERLVKDVPARALFVGPFVFATGVLISMICLFALQYLGFSSEYPKSLKFSTMAWQLALIVIPSWVCAQFFAILIAGPICLIFYKVNMASKYSAAGVGAVGTAFGLLLLGANDYRLFIPFVLFGALSGWISWMCVEKKMRNDRIYADLN